jgi:signal peptidase I
MGVSSTDEQSPAKATANDALGGGDAKPGFFSLENLRSLFILVVAVFALRWSVASPYHVPTSSMEPTIKVGDRLLAFKLAYNLKIPFTDQVVAEWGRPKRGDIIVFRYPKDPDIDYVKRVVGVAGDEIEVKDDILYINGTAQPRVETNTDADRTLLDDIEDKKEVKILYKETLDGLTHWVMQNTAPERHFGGSNWPPADMRPYHVPENAVFCMGDNRDNSTDSRVWNHVPLDYIHGKALFVIWSLHSARESSIPSFRFDRFGAWLY